MGVKDDLLLATPEHPGGDKLQAPCREAAAPRIGMQVVPDLERADAAPEPDDADDLAGLHDREHRRLRVVRERLAVGPLTEVTADDRILLGGAEQLLVAGLPGA